MKVLHVAETVQGGVATVLRQLLASQVNQGISTLCIIPHSQERELSGIGCDLYTFQRNGRGFFSFIKLFICFCIIFIKNKPDIVHLHSSFAGLICRVAMLLVRPVHKARVLYSPHGWSFMMDTPFFLKRGYALIEKTLLFLTDIVVCVSFFEKSSAEGFGIKPAKLVVIYNGVERPISSGLNSPFDSSFINILYVGRLDYAKGFDVLQAAFERLDKKIFRLTVVGGGVHDPVDLMPVDNMDYVGWLGRPELARFYSHADLLVMPSRWEAFGLVAVEALSYGLPVVASRCCSLPEIINEGVNGYMFEPGSSVDLCNLLNSKTKESWQDMRAAIGDKYFSFFSSEKMTAETIHLYKKILS